MENINEIDLCFIVDTTGSMGAFINAARQHMVAMIDRLTKAADVALRVAFVQYRDHPPQDALVFEAFAFTEDLEAAHNVIDSLQPQGGGDGPEAVLDGVSAACTELQWRAHARRLAVLVGDAPPHGTGSHGDGFPKGCPCGQTIESVTAMAEGIQLTLYAIGLTHGIEESFGRLAKFTGGNFFPSRQVEAGIAALEELLSQEFGQIDVDRAVLDAWRNDPSFTIDETALKLNLTSGQVAASVTRLSARRLLTQSPVLQAAS